ncbi:hypothetical protein BOO71_0014626 [Deinococcus marmoris]|uniref:Uncharacterized protein n=1 Tax=Deinococcus marmoris TaxID=249408 RepID=A0A1U7NRJ8_9DEIO|nr:hypothetical protein BOO71_0014626 [Deinococcus marmoris]
MSVAPTTLSQCSVANVFCPDQRQDKQGEQLDLVFPLFREVGDEAQNQ